MNPRFLAALSGESNLRMPFVGIRRLPSENHLELSPLMRIPKPPMPFASDTGSPFTGTIPRQLIGAQRIPHNGNRI